MVGMSGKNSEPRASGGGQRKHNPPHNKPQPPVEALQMARILEDPNYKSADKKVKEIMAVIPGRSEEEIYIALHDHDFDTQKALTALLDSDGSLGQGEWTTTDRRKGKKKGAQSDSIDLIVAPGDTKSKSGRSSKGTSRAASQSTREGYGGSVHVTSGESRGGGRGRGGGGGGRNQSGGRRQRTSIGGEKRSRGRESRDRGSKNKSLSSSSSPQTAPSTQAPVPGGVEVWNTAPTVTSDNTIVDTSWPPDSSQITASTKIESYWEEEEEPSIQRQPQQQQPPQHPIFPEAIPSSGTVAVSTPAETTPPLLSTATTVDRDTNVQVVLDQKESHTESTKPSGSKRSKRLARSQIPTKPVEMPAGIESLDVQFNELGIDFGGLESENVSVPVSSPTAITSSAVTTTEQLVTEPSANEISSLLSYDTEVQRLSEDPGVISVGQTALGGDSSSYHTAGTTPSVATPVEQLEVANISKEEEKTLEGPPGLTHPTTSNHETASHEMATLISTSAAAPPAPIELPHQANTVSQPHSFSVASSSDLLLSASTIASTVSLTSANPRTSSHTVQHSTASQSATQGKHSSSATVPPGMMYPAPAMVPQYPFSVMAAHMYPNYGDPADLGRGYPSSVSMAYYTSTSDPSIGGGLTGRDHSTSTYQEPAKFGHGADVTSPISSNPSQQALQQQSLQQGQQMGPHFYPYGSMFYPAAAMYHMPGFSHSIAPKPSGSGSTYPGVSTYQPPHQGNFAMSNYEDLGGAHDFSKMYSTSSLNKSTVLPTTTGGGSDIQSSSSFKHFDSSKSGYNYTMPQLGGSQGAGYMAGAAYMQMPTMAPMHHMAPVMPTGAHDASSQLQPSRGSQKHSSKSSGYNQSSAFWSAQGSHS